MTRKRRRLAHLPSTSNSASYRALRSGWSIFLTSNFLPLSAQCLAVPFFNRHLELQRDAAVDGALHLGGPGGNEIGHEFEVMVVEQVLTADRQFQYRSWPPAQVRIQRVVAGDAQAR